MQCAGKGTGAERRLYKQILRGWLHLGLRPYGHAAIRKGVRMIGPKCPGARVGKVGVPYSMVAIPSYKFGINSVFTVVLRGRS